MSRQSARTERSITTSPRGRPKRRAAATNYLFKYQLSGDPGRIEENALRKALQESLEEHKSTRLMTAGAAVIASKQTGKNKFEHNKSHINNRTSNELKVDNRKKQNVRAIINSSTNSSDVSKGSNDSSHSTTTATNSSCETCRDTTPTQGRNNGKTRLRSSANLPIATPTPTKRAKLTTNGHSNSSNSGSSGSIKNKCDNHDTSVLAGSPVPPLNRSVQKTYSRSQQSNQTNDHSASVRQPNNGLSPRTSTPIACPRQAAPDIKSAHREPGKPCVSRSTQTKIKSLVSQSNTTSIERIADSADFVATSKASQAPVTNKGPVSKDASSETSPPIQNQYLKFKRESKNYAYAKMTALKVNTSKSFFSGVSRSTSTSSKKGSPSSVLNNNSTNKKSSKLGFNSVASELRPGVSKNLSLPRSASPTIGDIGTSLSKSYQSSNSITKSSIPKNNLSATSQGVNNQTIDLSKNQADVSVSKKRITQGSWSLLGVPEEKILYLRDDEPPRRLICYPAIKHIEGDVIQVRDSVLLRSGAKQTDLPYIAKVCAFWQDAETGGVMMSLFWYYRPEHTEDGRKPHHLIDEIFASRHRDVDSVECIEDKCYVLTFNEYCRYRKRCKMEQVNAAWSLTDVTIPVSNESYPRRNRIPDSNVNPELVFCCRQIYDSRSKRLVKNPLINPKYGHI